jgi:hypothetical protein
LSAAHPGQKALFGTQLDKAAPILQQLEMIAHELVKQIDGITIEALHRQADPAHFHPFYAKVLRESALAKRVMMISHLRDLVGNSERGD